VGVAPDDKRSCRYRINETLFNKINIKNENTYVPNGLADPPEKELDIFRERIEFFGGIDLMILSIGMNGHIAFNEPGTAFDSSFRIAPISEQTRKDKAELFGGPDRVPKFGITMGIRDIMMSRQILLVAKGRSKAEVIRLITQGPITVHVPASIVTVHPNLIILIDKDAASFL
jgi:glucosamine-6-phosphate deaminase